MRQLEHNLLTRMVLMLCVLMQAVLLIPHHHHGDSAAICLDYAHMYTVRSCEDACTEPQTESDDDSGSCATDRFFISSPVAREHVTEVAWHEHGAGCDCPLCSPATRLDVPALMAAVVLGGNAVRTAEHTSYLREYFTDARPSRAPACGTLC